MKKIFSVISVVLTICILVCSIPVSARSDEFVSFDVQTVSVTNSVENIKEYGYVYDDTLFVSTDFLCKYTMYYYDSATTSFVRNGHSSGSFYGRVKLDIENKVAKLCMNPFSTKDYTLKNVFVFNNQVFLPLDQMASLLKATVVVKDNVVRIISSAYSLADAEYAIETIAMNNEYIAYDYEEILEDIYFGEEYLMGVGGALSYFGSTIFDKRISNLAIWGDNKYSYYESFLTDCITDNESYINALANSDDMIARLTRASGATESIKNGGGKIKDITTMLADLAEPMKDYDVFSLDIYVNCSGISEALKPLLKLVGYADYFLKTSSMLEDHQKMLENYIGRIGSSELAKDSLLNTSGSAYLAALISVYEKYGRDFVENSYAKLGEDFAKDLTDDIIKEAIKSKSEVTLSTLLKASMVISFVNTMFELMGFDLSTNSEFNILTSVSVKSDLFNDLNSLPDNHYSSQYQSEKYRLAAIFLLLACKQVFEEANKLSAKYEGSETLYNNRIENVDTILGLFYQAAESKNYDNFKSVNDLIESNKKILVDSGIAKNAPKVSQEEVLLRKDNLKSNWTEEEVLARFNEYLDFTKEWIYNYKLYGSENSASFPGDDRIFVKIDSSKYKTCADIRGGIGKYYESGEAVNFIKDSYVDKNGSLYFAYYPTEGLEPEYSDLKVKKQSDGTFKITYTEITGAYEALYFDKEVVFKPNSKGEWYFYDVSSTLRENNNDWVSAYREFLTNYGGDEYTGFSLCYIDDDDIPELVIGTKSEYAGYGDNLDVYTYNNGEIYLVLPDIGFSGIIEYLERENKICFRFISGTGTMYEIYEINNGTATCIWEGSDNINQSEFPTAHSNGVEVSLEEYEALLVKYYPEERMSSNRNSGYLITEENINKYVTE